MTHASPWVRLGTSGKAATAVSLRVLGLAALLAAGAVLVGIRRSR